MEVTLAVPEIPWWVWLIVAGSVLHLVCGIFVARKIHRYFKGDYDHPECCLGVIGSLLTGVVSFVLWILIFAISWRND